MKETKELLKALKGVLADTVTEMKAASSQGVRRNRACEVATILLGMGECERQISVEEQLRDALKRSKKAEQQQRNDEKLKDFISKERRRPQPGHFLVLKPGPDTGGESN